MARLFGLTRYAREALRLVWQTDRVLTVCLIGLTTAAGILPAAVAYVAKLIIDAVVHAVATHAPEARNDVLSLLGVELALVVTLIGLQRGLAVCDALLRVRLAQRVIELVLDKALGLRISDFENATFYDQLRQVREQATERPLSLVRRGLTSVQLGVGLVGFLALLAAYSPWIVLLLLIGASPAVVIEARFNADAFRLYRRHSPEARRQSYLEMVLTSEAHVKEVKALGLGPVLLQRHRQIFQRWYREDRALTLRRAGWGLGLALLGAAALAASYAWTVWQAIAGAISVGSLAMLFAVLRQAQNAATELLLVVAGMYDDNLYISTLHEFLAYPSSDAPGQTVNAPKPGDGLRFEGVEFRYPGSAEPAVTELDLHLPPGTKLAIAGRNGSGKSTFVKLALGLYVPTQGRILLDGRDLREIDFAALARRFSVLFQDFVHYQQPVSDNIGFGDVSRLDDEASWIRAAQNAGVHELLQALPEGYRTQLGHGFEAGHELSLGEWQKLALARVFMRTGADIIILDEPSSSLDAQAEAAVLEQCLRFASNRTALLISHRTSTLRMADKIMMLERGRCVALGSHDELIAKPGPYAELFGKEAVGDC